jgi:hypothetical protein
MQEVIPANCQLLLKQLLVVFWAKDRVDWFLTEILKESFLENIQ